MRDSLLALLIIGSMAMFSIGIYALVIGCMCKYLFGS